MKHAKLIIVVVAVLACVAGLWLYIASQSETGKIAPQAAPPTPSFEKQFEEVLNDFLADIEHRARVYKNQRKVLGELVKPDNLRDSAYIEENYRMMQALGPALAQLRNEFIGVFGEVEAKIKGLLAGQRDDVRAVIWGEWQELKDQHANRYIDFFMLEEDVFEAYEALMSFYYVNQQAYHVDEKSGRIVFKNPEDERRSKELLEKILSLSEKQSEVLRAK